MGKKAFKANGKFGHGGSKKSRQDLLKKVGGGNSDAMVDDDDSGRGGNKSNGNDKVKVAKLPGREEQKGQVAKSLIVARLERHVTRQKDHMRKFGGVEETNLAKEAPQYHLIGPARAALEHYRPPNYRAAKDPVNLLMQYKGKMWEHEEGQKLLGYLLEYAVALHNVVGQTRNATSIFNEILEEDPEDHMDSRHDLLRCYMDNAQGDLARDLIVNKYPNDTSACFSYNLAILEHISLMIEEEDASIDKKNAALKVAFDRNPFVAFMIANFEVFEGLFEQTEAIAKPVTYGTMEEAIVFFEVDIELWKDTENAVDWIKEYVRQNKVTIETMKKSIENVTIIDENTEMFVEMFKTGLDMLEDN